MRAGRCCVERGLPRHQRRSRRAWAGLGLALCGALAFAAPVPPVDAEGHAGWRAVHLPRQTLPKTTYDHVTLDGQPALRLRAEGSYGHLVHELPKDRQVRTLRWAWQLNEPNDANDLKTKAGDDNAIKVCVLLDAPLSSVPFVERQLLRIARAASREPLPAATLCYVWDSHLPAGTVLANAYTRRVRLMVLRGPEAPLGTWQTESRDVAADVMRVFGDELKRPPPASALLVGADADNTGARSVALLRGLQADIEDTAP